MGSIISKIMIIAGRNKPMPDLLLQSVGLLFAAFYKNEINQEIKFVNDFLLEKLKYSYKLTPIMYHPDVLVWIFQSDLYLFKSQVMYSWIKQENDEFMILAVLEASKSIKTLIDILFRPVNTILAPKYLLLIFFI